MVKAMKVGHSGEILPAERPRGDVSFLSVHTASFPSVTAHSTVQTDGCSRTAFLIPVTMHTCRGEYCMCHEIFRGKSNVGRSTNVRSSRVVLRMCTKTLPLPFLCWRGWSRSPLNCCARSLSVPCRKPLNVRDPGQLAQHEYIASVEPPGSTMVSPSV